MARGSSSNIQRMKLRRVQSLEAAARQPGVEHAGALQRTERERRHAVVGQEGAVGARARSASPRPSARTARRPRSPRAASRPVTSACPMPSPVSRSDAADRVAGEQRSTRGRGGGHLVDPGRDRPGPVRTLRLVRRARAGRATWGRARRSGQSVGHVLDRVRRAAAVDAEARRWPDRPAAGTTRGSRAGGRARRTRTAPGRPRDRPTRSTGGRRGTRRGSRRGPRRAACAPATTCRRRPTT